MRRYVLVVMCVVMMGALVQAEEVRWVPVAASNPGLHGTMWTTDVWVYTQVADVPLEISVAFLPTAEGTEDPVEVTIEVQPSDVLEIKDIVGTLFGESRAGALRFRADYPFDVQSRTYNDGGDLGSFGQGIPAVKPSAAMEGWILVGGANIPGDDGVRSNVGLVNMSDEEVDGSLLAFAQPGNEYLGQIRVELGPYGWMQLDPCDELGVGDQELELVGVVGIFHPGTVQAYLSRVDNRSGDGTYVMPFYGESVYTIPVQWDVDLTLSFSSGVTIDQLVYTGEDGNDVVVESPASPFSVDLEFTSPAEFCYSVSGMVDVDGGSIEVVVHTARDGGAPAEHTSYIEAFGGGEEPEPLGLDEDCIELY